MVEQTGTAPVSSLPFGLLHHYNSIYLPRYFTLFFSLLSTKFLKNLNLSKKLSSISYLRDYIIYIISYLLCLVKAFFINTDERGKKYVRSS